MTRKAVPGKQNFGLFVYDGKKKKSYYVRRENASKEPLDKRLRSDNLNDARREMQEVVRDWLGVERKPKVQKLMFELWEEFILTKADKSQGTIDSIKYSGKHLVPHFGNHLPDEIDADQWEKYISLKRKTSPDRKFFNDWKWFNMFLHYMLDHGHMVKRPKIRNPDPRRSEAGRIFSDDQVNDLLNFAGPELRLQILMGATMGMRIGEILNLTWERMDLKAKTIHLRAQDTKIRRARTFKMSDEVFSTLNAYKTKVGPLFPSPKDPLKTVGRGGNKSAWRSCRNEAGVDGRFHDLRHTFLTKAFKSSKGRVDLMLICEYAGLSIEQAQETYLHFTHEDTGIVSELVSFGGRENGGKHDK